MARPTSTTIPNNPLTETEELDRQAFKAAFVKDYGIVSESDLLILDLASYEYIKSRRLQTQELTNGHIMGNIRFHPVSELVRLLGMMDATPGVVEQSRDERRGRLLVHAARRLAVRSFARGMAEVCAPWARSAHRANCVRVARGKQAP